MTGTTARIRVDKKLVDEAMRLFGVRTGTEAVQVALKETIGLRRFKASDEFMEGEDLPVQERDN